MSRFYGREIFLLLFALSLGPLVGLGESLADPSKYPQYAQQQIPGGVQPDFINLEQLVEQITTGKKPLIVDVRSAEEYEEAHIKAAISIPLGEIPMRLAEIPKNRPVALY